MSWRYIAQRALTHEWLDWDLPITRDDLTWDLSGPGYLSGTLTPDVGSLRTSDGRLMLEEWGTYIYAEEDGIIRWGGIVTRSHFEGSSWRLECAGFSSYPHGMPYVTEYRQIGVDPVDAVKEIWRHVQSFPDAQLGVSVVGDSTPVRLGSKAEPYELVWWESQDCGEEIDSLASESPFDYVEQHAWTDAGTVSHTIKIGYPRLGRRRNDLAFIQGENIDSLVTVTRDGDSYANEIVGLGAGEGRSMLRRATAVRDGRLRRSGVYTDKMIKSQQRLDAAIRKNLGVRRSLLSIDSIQVTSHTNARIGAWDVGDDILIRAEIPWLGEIAHWARITSWSLIGDDRAELKLQRSDIADPHITPIVVTPSQTPQSGAGYVTSYVQNGV